MRVFLSNLGCKLNQAEVDQLARSFRAAGHRIVDAFSEADIHVVNTCTVTHLAARDSRKIARRGKRVNPRLRTVLTGCYVAAEPEEAARRTGADLVVPNHEKNRLLEKVQEAFPQAGQSTERWPRFPESPPPQLGRSRAPVKVEDGCNMRCSFCVIPATRGHQRSRPLPEVVGEVTDLAAAGFQEVVVTGVQISAYRWEENGLYDLLRAILEQTGIGRVRLTSIAPWRFDLRLLDLFDSGRLCRHVHLSLQSGCAATLRRMRRPYDPDAFARLLEALRAAVPGLAVTTDLIVGFPGEDDDEFDDSLKFARQMQFARIHVFPFSPRPNTAAASLPRQVPFPLKRSRMKRALEEALSSRQRFEQRHVDTTALVLWEERKRRLWHGLTDNYLRAFSDSGADLAGRITSARLVAATRLGLRCSEFAFEPGPPPAARPPTAAR